MKYPLDCKDSFESSFIFWLTRYVKFKLSSLSNKELRDPKALASVNFAQLFDYLIKIVLFVCVVYCKSPLIVFALL